MSEIVQRVEALRRPLLFASQDGFRGLERVRGLGQTLRAACDLLVDVAPPEPAAALSAWRRALSGFESLDKDGQAYEVARGLRLCQTMAGPASRSRDAAPPTPPPPGGGVGVRSLSSQPTTALSGIGPALAARLAERGLDTVEDLAWFVPRRYDDVRIRTPLAAAAAAAASGDRFTTAGAVTRCRYARRGPRGWLEVGLADGAAHLTIRWFNVHGSMASRFPRGSRVVVSGRVGARGGAVEMANPDVLEVTLPDGSVRSAGRRILPRYPDVPGVPPATLRKACLLAVDKVAGELPDGLPAAVAARQGLPPLAAALRALHGPPDDLEPALVDALNAGTSVWQKRLAFDELFFLGLAVARRRRERRADQAVPCARPPGGAGALASAFPFALTAAQERAIAALSADLAAPVPMNRLLQGDVGSGKTAVAFAAAHQVIAAGRQVALMAPTEILAEQHLAAMSPWCRALGVRAALLTASTPVGVRASLQSLLAAGQLDLLIGTHSLLAEGVGFAALGLAIVDEQHRFGVAQRVRLRSKGDGQGAPHLLVMTATPIPRTLALTAYGDLDVTTIDERPPGRSPPATRVLAGARGRQQAYTLLRKRCAAGARAFVVCPLVEPSEEIEGKRWAAATAVAAELEAALAPLRVGLVHGRLSAADRDRVMTRFRAGELDVLVATTVIEVGVDVPQATVMLVEDADRFGLAQLHQLRGRIGRGGGASDCLLLTRGGRSAEGAERLGVMAETCDGFKIAEADLAQRGPGELLGVRQAGLPKLRFGDLREHVSLLAAARDEADRLLAADPDLARPEHAVTAAVLAARTAEGPAFGAEGG